MAIESIQHPSIPLIAEHIVRTPGVCGGRPRVAGQRITVENIVIDHERGGMSPDEIVFRYPGLTLSDVYAALAYYHDHLAEIRSSIEADDALVAERRGKSSSMVENKLKLRDASHDSLPPG